MAEPRPIVNRTELVKSAEEYSTVFLTGVKTTFINETQLRGHFEQFGPIKAIDLDYVNRWAHLHFEKRSDAVKATQQPYDGVTGRVYLPNLTAPPSRQQFTLEELNEGADRLLQTDYMPPVPNTGPGPDSQFPNRIYPKILTGPDFEEPQRVPSGYNLFIGANMGTPARQRSNTNPFGDPHLVPEFVPSTGKATNGGGTPTNKPTTPGPEVTRQQLAGVYAVVHDNQSHTNKLHGRVNQTITEMRGLSDQLQKMNGSVKDLETSLDDTNDSVNSIEAQIKHIQAHANKMAERSAHFEGQTTAAANAVDSIPEITHSVKVLHMEVAGAKKALGQIKAETNKLSELKFTQDDIVSGLFLSSVRF
jgi:archaellum component FlaC